MPEICNRVFIRQVNSRIPYEQMLGRAIRLCDEIGKQAFRVFDAADIYTAISNVSEMEPVVNKPNFSLKQLVDELGMVQDSAAVGSIIDEMLAKLQRKKWSLRHASLTLSNDRKEAIEALTGVPVEGGFELLNRTF